MIQAKKPEVQVQAKNTHLVSISQLKEALYDNDGLGYCTISLVLFAARFNV